MKKIYTAPETLVVALQVESTLCVGSDNDGSIVKPGTPSTGGEEDLRGPAQSNRRDWNSGLWK